MELLSAYWKTYHIYYQKNSRLVGSTGSLLIQSQFLKMVNEFTFRSEDLFGLSSYVFNYIIDTILNPITILFASKPVGLWQPIGLGNPSATRASGRRH